MYGLRSCKITAKRRKYYGSIVCTIRTTTSISSSSSATEHKDNNTTSHWTNRRHGIEYKNGLNARFGTFLVVVVFSVVMIRVNCWLEICIDRSYAEKFVMKTFSRIYSVAIGFCYSLVIENNFIPSQHYIVGRRTSMVLFCSVDSVSTWVTICVTS